MKKIFILSVSFWLAGLSAAHAAPVREEDSSAYFARYHEAVGRKCSLRRMGPGEKYPALQGGPGLGSAVITPSGDVVAGGFGTWEIVYTAGEAGLGTNEAINIYIPYGFNPPLLHYPTFPRDVAPNGNEERSRAFSPGLTTVRTDNPEAGLILYSSIRDLSRQSEGTNLYIGVSGAPLRAGDKITVTYGDTRYGSPGASAAYFAQDHEFTTFVLKNVDWDKFEDMVNSLDRQGAELYTAAGEIYCLENPPALHVVGGEAVKLVFTVPSVAAVNEPFDLHVLPVDRLGNESGSYRGRLSFASGRGVSLPAEYSVEQADREFIRIPGGGKISEPGVYRLVVRDDDKPLAGESNPIKIVPGPGTKKIFWGDLHVHSYESDGIGSPDHNNRFCRDIAALDYCCICDHARGVFQQIRESAIKFTRPGRFLSFSGFEGLAGDMPGGGHVNFYFVDESPRYETVFRAAAGEREGLESRSQLWKELLGLGEKKVIAVPHNHNGGGWEDMDSPVVRLDEIHSVWGNSEYTATQEKAYLFGHTTYRTFQQALAAGLKMGCIGAGDEHAGRGGTGTWLRHYRSNSAGISAACADTLTRQAIFGALWDRRVYATTGARILLEFSVNGQTMGGELELSDPSAARKIRVMVEGTDSLEYLAVIKNNREFYRQSGSGKGLQVEITDDSPVAGTDFYYVRAVQQDGHLAWASPVWVSAR
ncbi:MAG: DUF3604 domain-containing protein [Candidatus Glassbacteria bacterium]|nr:DUF3604 domain-containing protein [Candidatus Glassbacteria bacterium]